MVLIAGGTGLVGKHLIDMLLREHQQIIVLTHDKKKSSDDARIVYAYWNPHEQVIADVEMRQVKAVINLSGANVAQGRWTKKRKQEILSSRTESTTFLSRLADERMPQLECFVQASAIGFYGEDKGSVFQEDTPAADNFLGRTCDLWEKALTAHKTRCVTLRIGLVFSEDGGFFASLLPMLRLGIQPIFGNGKQYWSWIHIDDLCRQILHAIHHPSLTGTYNATAGYDQQKDITLAFFKAKKRIHLGVWIPSFLLRWMIGEMSVELLKSARVANDKIKHTGFSFRYDSLPSLFV